MVKESTRGKITDKRSVHDNFSKGIGTRRPDVEGLWSVGTSQLFGHRDPTKT